MDLKRGTLAADMDATDGLPLGVELASSAHQWPVDRLGHCWVIVNPAYLQDLADCVTAEAAWSLDPAAPAVCAVLAVSVLK